MGLIVQRRGIMSLLLLIEVVIGPMVVPDFIDGVEVFFALQIFG
jgi:hypothetical protein